MNNLIKNALLNGRLVLLLGAGASRGCRNGLSQDIPLGGELAEILAQELGETLDGEDLADVYAAARTDLGSQVDSLLERHFKHCTPSKEYIELSKYPFFRIYSLNIDDAFEKAVSSQPNESRKKFNVRQRNDSVVEPDQFFQTLDYIKLNGDVNLIKNGFIFSPQEYADGSSTSPLWYQELARDFHRYTFIFIGTQLKEPLFNHQVAKFKAKTGTSNLKSYILIPSLSSIQQKGLSAANIEHLAGTLGDFTSWLKDEFPTPPKSAEIIANVRPELSKETQYDGKNIALFTGVTPVNRATLALMEKDKSKSKIRNFYKGFKPTWFDIMDGVPALLCKTDTFYNTNLSNNHPTPLDLYVMFGTAGAGKSTALRQLALRLSEEGDRPVYFIDEFKNDLHELISELDYRNEKPYYLFIDRINDVAYEVSKIIKSHKSSKVIFVTSENPKIWKTRVQDHLQEFVKGSVDISELSSKDADLILDKLRVYGNWTRLQKMPHKKRRVELLKKSKRQLLIGLLETTTGEGYQKIIQKDYKSIECSAEKSLLILAGLATTQGVSASEVTLTRAMSHLGENPNIHYVASAMDGLVEYKNGSVTTRHRVYIENLFRYYVSSRDLYEAICAYINAFSVYHFPIVKHISTSEFSVYKYLVNAKALKKLFKEDKKSILSIYEKFEKAFENEGLFLMQYGLSLRSFGHNQEAYEKLKIAQQAFPESPHIEHALAMQRIILACTEKDETVALALFAEAEEVLTRLDSSNISPASGGTDRYPIITLSEGHVKVLVNLGHISQAKIIARNYYERISKNSELKDNFRIKKTLTNLMKFSLNGKWSSSDGDEF
ncbi:SIR2 family protein [Vibrio vulnificus]|uniref:P-loop NTPase n=1 Tax=Vibrio vulnificus TaxID=672 RepID=UPI0009263A75|nr:SIR2 family protein [Vibrio vulnificus]EGQ9990874.1 cold-shock protein [Vibrio vulnificus]EHH0803003.1 cold-shock protein [Vibrio vulnificus]EJE8534805.1 SIR2 family protein [Vibrio vulnificus]EJV2651133.1 SIR2 family protein [Vibrio vulnificus]MCU8423292.1 SIR2 family protein [Vibrio vulnificus]